MKAKHTFPILALFLAALTVQTLTFSAKAQVTDFVGERLAREATGPKNGHPMKMAIVAPRKFRAAARDYALWKTQQGYDVDEVYSDDFNDGGALEGEAWARSIQTYLKELRPTFVLIMGDDYHVPTFLGTQNYKTTYVTDYYYGEYDGEDFFPEAFVGRFSADTEAQLRAQMDKTKYMSQLPAEKGAWLNTSVGLHSYSEDIKQMEGAHQYTMEYVQKYGSTAIPTGGGGNTMNGYLNEGCAMLTYWGHGMKRGFIGYTSTDALQLQNKGRYPLVVATTCLSGTFNNYYPQETCMAEDMQRMTDAGSVAVLAATREGETWAMCYWMYGGKKEGQSYLGFLASMFPLSSDDPLNQHARTLGEAVAIGNFAIHAYQVTPYLAIHTEYFELFGDPTYQPYLKAPLTMAVTAPATAVAGHIINVTAAPGAVVCVSKGREIVAVGQADSQGHVAMKIKAVAEEGTYSLYCTAPTYTDWEGTLTITANDGTQDDDPAEEIPVAKTVLTASDIINAETAQTQCDQWNPVEIAGTSGAQYKAIVSSTYKPCVLMRNKYDLCGIVSTTSGGHLRKVSIDWLQKQGLPDRISVYASNTSYTETSDVWDDSKKGTLVGTIEKGVNDEIVVKGNYQYVALRAENMDILMRSITIGWGGETYQEVNNTQTYNVQVTGAEEGKVIYKGIKYGHGESFKAADLTEGQLSAKRIDGYYPAVVSISGNTVTAAYELSPDDPNQKAVTITDKQEYKASEADYYDKITYVREFNNTEWQALYVPFAMNCAEWSEYYDIARIYNFIDYDDNDDGTFDRTYLVVQKKTSGSTKPNYPYLIRAKSPGTFSLVLRDRMLEAAESNYVNCGSVDFEYAFYGTYSDVTNMRSSGYYALSNGALKQAADDSAVLKAQRWYMKKNDRSNSYSTRLQDIHILVEEDVTAIDALTTGGKLQANDTFDITGRKVKQNTDVRGVNLINGRKIIR